MYTIKFMIYILIFLQDYREVILTRDSFVQKSMVISVAFLVVTTRGQGTTGIWWAESRDAAEPPTMHRKAFHNKDL